jgi:deoxyribodipyrimidine photo-lyase
MGDSAEGDDVMDIFFPKSQGVFMPRLHQILLSVIFMVNTIPGAVRSMTTMSTTIPGKSSISNMSKSPAGGGKVVLHWFRHGDLRLHDNPALVFSSQRQNTDHVVPVFCFDRNVFGSAARTPTGSLKCGPKRAQFVQQSVADLRANLQTQLKSELLLAHGEPAAIFDRILGQFKGRQVDIVVQEEVLKEERDAVTSVRTMLKKHCSKGTVHTIWGSTMYDRADLPYADDLHDMPDVFTPFRNKVEKHSTIRNPLPIPATFSFPAEDVANIQDMISFMPSLADLGYESDDVEEAECCDERGVMAFHGGESAALKRLKEYIWDKDLLKGYFDTRNGMIGADYSTKLSPWLAHGCVSPRVIAFECKKYETQRVANKSTYWVVFELLWRDYCKFFALKYGDKLFYPGGTVGSDKKWPSYAKNFEAWKEGRTGYPLVDANMRELKATGFMSNRGRQNVASFLALDCNNDWRAGGDWFETNLLDYDVYSNWVVSIDLSSCVFARQKLISRVLKTELVCRCWHDGRTRKPLQHCQAKQRL